MPGEASHHKMAPIERLEELTKQSLKKNNAKRASVMALFYPNKNGETHLALILRKTYKGVHSAQVGFPGGKQESSDLSSMHTALRETQEEIGVLQKDIIVLKKLTQIFIPPSNFFVEPFIGVCQNTPHFTLQQTEVEALIEVKLSDLREKRNFWDAWLKAFSNTVDLKIEGQKKLADVYDEMGNPRQADRIRSLIVKQNRSGRFDLAIKEGAEQIMNKLEKKLWEDAEKLFERMVKDFEKTAGGELYYGLVRPYVETLARSGKKEQAMDAIDFLKKRNVLDLGPGSIIGLEMQKLLQKIN